MDPAEHRRAARNRCASPRSIRSVTRRARCARPQVERVDSRVTRSTFLGGLIGAYELSTGPYAGEANTRRSAEPRARSAVGLDANANDCTRARVAARADGARSNHADPRAAHHRDSAAGDQVDARRKSELLMLRAVGAFTPLANLCDLPAIAVPSGVDDRGRPLSIMFVAGRGGEATLLRIALAVERTGLGTTPV